ncbi:hypothetical protein OSTOST_07667, partial [Ostertagia ostertagi]
MNNTQHNNDYSRFTPRSAVYPQVIERKGGVGSSTDGFIVLLGFIYCCYEIVRRIYEKLICFTVCFNSFDAFETDVDGLHPEDGERGLRPAPAAQVALGQILLRRHSLGMLLRLVTTSVWLLTVAVTTASSAATDVNFENALTENHQRMRHRSLQSVSRVNPRGMAFSMTIVVQLHPLFITKVDRAFHVRCFYMEAEKAVGAQIGV